MGSVELPPDEPADVVAAGFMVEACLGISEGDQVRVEEEGHLTLEGAPLGSVKTIFRLSRQWSDPVAVTVWTSIRYGKQSSAIRRSAILSNAVHRAAVKRTEAPEFFRGPSTQEELNPWPFAVLH